MLIVHQSEHIWDGENDGGISGALKKKRKPGNTVLDSSTVLTLYVTYTVSESEEVVYDTLFPRTRILYSSDTTVVPLAS